MEHRRLIVTFLSAVGVRLKRRALVQGMLYWLAIVGALSLAAPLMAQSAGLDAHSAWFVLAFAGLVTLGCGLFAVWLPRKRWAEHAAQARYVGEQDRALRSDLLSAVEFMSDDASAGSADLREALLMSCAERVAPLRLQALVPFEPVRRPLAALGLVVAAYLSTLVLAPTALEDGWRSLLAAPAARPFGGATLAHAPLVGDIDIVVAFPDYTGRPNLVVPSSSGDFQAMPGSTVELRTRAPGGVSKASLLLSQTDELESDEEVPLDAGPNPSGGKGTSLSGMFRVMHETYYRFQVVRSGERTVESRARHVTIAKDEVPTIELYAPAEELDVAKLKRIELAYVASDDYGIRKIDLVYTPAGGEPMRMPLEVVSASALPALGVAPRNAQHKYLWDLSELPLRPGIQIEYHLEAFDNDDVLGPNIGRSRSYSLRLFSPRERHEELIAQQALLAEHMLALLADRLVLDTQSLHIHRAVQRDGEAVVVEIGGLVAALKDDEFASAQLIQMLSLLRTQMDQRLGREDAILSGLEKVGAAPSKALVAMNAANTAELEDNVLMLRDWISRQQLENSMRIGDEVKASRERLDKLFEEYARTGSDEVLSEIERELKNLERKLAEQRAREQQLPEDILDRFMNLEGAQALAQKDCLGEVQELLAEGKAAAAHERMKECSKDLDAQAENLEKRLSELRGENFSEEQKAFEEMMSDVADAARDQQEIADKASEIYKRYANQVAELQKGKSAEAKNVAGETLAKLRRSVDKIPKSGLTPFTREEMTVLEARLKDIETMLERGELAEALSMAKHARESLKTIREELEFSLDEAWSRKGVVAEKAARAALPVARKLVEELQAVTPAPSEIMSGDDRRALDKLRRMQRGNRNRASKLLKKLESTAESLPGDSAKAVKEGVEAARKHMQEAEGQMRKRDPSGARQEASEALAKLLESQAAARGAARKRQELGQGNWRDEPVRIPGAEDYKTPEKFREEILDAMQDEAAPSGYSEQVKQYYKDIIQ